MIFRFLILSSLLWLSACSNYDPELVARLSTKKPNIYLAQLDADQNSVPPPPWKLCQRMRCRGRTIDGNWPNVAGDAIVAQSQLGAPNRD